MTDTLDLHAWVETADGRLLDWDFEAYGEVRRIRDLNDTPYYVPECGENPRRAMALIREHIKERKAYLGCSTKQLLETFYTAPQYGCCFLNAYAYVYFNRDCRVIIGSMGYEKKDGSGIWWEYGPAKMGMSRREARERYPLNRSKDIQLTGSRGFAREITEMWNASDGITKRSRDPWKRVHHFSTTCKVGKNNMPMGFTISNVLTADV
tara:strand:+ start:1171 stop:1794 length:624 start_codon:yes stop_codon:yes gene_type:complete